MARGGRSLGLVSAVLAAALVMGTTAAFLTRPAHAVSLTLAQPNVAPAVAATAAAAPGVTSYSPNIVTVTSPGDQTSVAGRSLTLQAAAASSQGAALSYAAAGLPAGLSIAPGSGSISGTPTKLGASSVTLMATDTTGASGSTSFTWTVRGPTAPTITSAQAATYTVGVSTPFKVTTSGFPTPAISATGNPANVYLFDNHDGTANVVANPEGGIFPFTITATNGFGSDASQSFIFTLNTAPHIFAAPQMSFGVGVSVTIAVGVTGFPKPTATESGTMPSGLSFNSATPAYTGAAAAGSVGTYPITLTAANGIGSPASQDVILTVDQATMTYPTNGQLNVDTTRAFTWSTIPDAYAYVLWIGTTPGGSELLSSSYLPPSQASFTVPALPSGPTLYATIAALISHGSTIATVAFNAAPGQASLTYPANGQPGIDSTDTTRPFRWSTIPQAQGYILVVGTTQYGTNLVNSGILPPTQSSFAMPILPAGQALYATLLTKVNGAFTRFQAIVFTARPAMGTFTYPVDWQLMVGGTASRFTWSTIAGAQNYYLVVGTSQYGTNLLNSGVLPPTQSSYPVPAFPTGRILYATLLTKVKGTWVFQAIHFAP
ncbi:MAG: Ig domain-containing protein [Actinomycetota bacterium]|nr:Ig domain-containing protein [Actinomycetota bacterium]